MHDDKSKKLKKLKGKIKEIKGKSREKECDIAEKFAVEFQAKKGFLF